MEDLVLRAGPGMRDVLDGVYDLDGDLAVNPDGGLKSFGHPVGASGLRMMFEAWLQLRGEAPGEERRIASLAAVKKLALTAQPRRLPGRDGELRLAPRRRPRLTRPATTDPFCGSSVALSATELPQNEDRPQQTDNDITTRGYRHG